MIDWVLVVAIDGVNWVSSCAIVTWIPSDLLSLATASCAKCSCSRPTSATGPVNGPSIAIEALQGFVDAALALERELGRPPLAALALALLLLLLLLPQPVAISAVSATATRIRRTFIGLASPEQWVLVDVPTRG